MASQRFWRLVKLYVPIGTILLISAYLFTSSSSTYNQLYDTPAEEVALRKADFIHKATEWDIDGPFNNTALQKRCKNNDWVEGLHFKCGSAIGGIGNVRNIALTCVRYAIEAGGKML